jgi:transposase
VDVIEILIHFKKILTIGYTSKDGNCGFPCSLINRSNNLKRRLYLWTNFFAQNVLIIETERILNY